MSDPLLDATLAARRLPPEHPDGIKRLQVGCGPHHIRPEWWNTDLRAFPGIDEALDATKPWRWQGVLEFVYAEHFLEHLQIEDAVQFLAHAGRALKVGGRIRLSTPSLEWVLKSHFSFQPKDLQSRLLDTFHINRAFHGWGHQFLYSREMLHELLKQVGFEQIAFHQYGESGVAQLQGLEKHPTGAGLDGYSDVWIVEAERGERVPAVGPWLSAWLRNTYTKWSHAKH
jgi:predicted SAM-dependent methyltransferase